MKVVLETQLVLGKTIVAALVRNVVHEHHSGNHVAVIGDRSPLAVVIKVGDQIDAFTLQGEPLAISQLKALYPDAIAALMSTDLS